MNVDENSRDNPRARAWGHRHGMRSAMSELERALAASPTTVTDEWTAVVRAQLELLRVSLERHIANTEGDGGLFEEVIRDVPRLVPRVTSCVATTALTVELTALAQRLDEPVAGHSVAVVREAGSTLLTHLVHHRYLGSDLLYETYNIDIDAAD